MAFPRHQLHSENRTRFPVLDVRVDALQIPEVISIMKNWIARRQGCRYIAVTGMHGVMEAQRDPGFRAVLHSADLVVADGTPLVWLGRLQGLAIPRRVYGPELMLEFFACTREKRYRHFFYGGAPGVADLLASKFVDRFPGTFVAGTFSPPYRPLAPQEEEEVVRSLNASRADVIWVGLGTPKQERWMHRLRQSLTAPVLVGVGAAFDFHTGRLRSAPRWMGDHGLEWLFRLVQEPARLWRRYLLYGSQFVVLVLLEQLGFRRRHRST
jgi:N-acetylglucosaminyldiphosphoundecaprenol N-acetyl-beta-D-mannosaminyltransferase